VKPEWGTKRQCPECATRFYDLQKSPIVCPNCGVQFEPEALLKVRRTRAEPRAERRATPARPVRRTTEEEPLDYDDETEEEEEEEEEETLEAGLDEDVVDDAGEDDSDEVEAKPVRVRGRSTDDEDLEVADDVDVVDDVLGEDDDDDVVDLDDDTDDVLPDDDDDDPAPVGRRKSK